MARSRPLRAQATSTAASAPDAPADPWLTPAGGGWLDRRAAWLVALAFVLAHAWLFFKYAPTVDVKLYFTAADEWVRGGTPYKDRVLEYPPGALLLFVLPRLFTDDPAAYCKLFAAEMLLCELLTLRLLWLLPGALAGEDARSAKKPREPVLTVLAYLFLIALLGPLSLERFDNAVALSTTAFFVAALRGKRRWIADLLLAMGVWVKLVPVILLPLYLAFLFAKDSEGAPAGPLVLRALAWTRTEGLRRIALFIAFTAALFFPFWLMAGADLFRFVGYHSARGIQLESTYAGFLMIANRLWSLGIERENVFGASHLKGSFTLSVAAASSVVFVLAFVPIFWRFTSQLLREERESGRRALLLRGSLALLLTFIAASKVFSPQFVFWVAPLAALSLADRRFVPRPNTTLVVCVYLLTGLILHAYYGNLMKFEPLGIALLMARNLGVIWLIVALTLALPQRPPTPAPSPDRARLFALASFALVLLWMLLASLSETTTNDIFVQMRTARDILQSGHFPTVETYSATAAGRPYIAHEWLSGMLFVWANQLSPAALSALCSLCALGCVLLLVFALEPSVRRKSFVYLLLFYCSYILLFRVLLRPHLFSLVALCAVIFAIERWRRSGAFRDLVWLIPLQILWINLHGEAPIGPLVLCLLTALVWLAVRFPSLERDAPRRFTMKDVKQVGVVAACTLAACLVNPYGIGLFGFSFSMLEGNDYFKNAVVEWKPFFWEENASRYWFALTIGLALALWGTLFARRAQRPLIDLALSALATWLTLKASRFAVYFPIFAFPILARSWASDLPRFFTERALSLRPRFEWIVGGLLIASTCLYGYGYAPFSHRPLSWGIGGSFAFREIELIRQRGYHGVIFCDYVDGAPIIDKLYPAVRPVMDSRIDIYGKALYEEYVESQKSLSGFLTYLARHNVDLVLLRMDKARPAYMALRERPEWTLVSEDAASFLFVRNQQAAR